MVKLMYFRFTRLVKKPKKTTSRRRIIMNTLKNGRKK